MANSLLILLSRINRTNLPFLITFFITFINLSNIICKTCKESTALTETDCFNNIIIINKDDNRYYRAGHFATSKNGDLIIEYSGDGPSDYRLFYSFKKNGRGYFNDNYIKEKQLVTSANYIGRYESMNIFIHLYEDSDTEYLFSTSAYASASELHDLDSDTYLVADTQTFMGKRIFSYVYNMLETTEDGKTIYFIFYTTPLYNPDDDNGERFVIKKLKFPEFKLDYTTSHITWKIDNNFNDRVACGFLFEDIERLGILFIHDTDKTFVVRFFDYSLNEIGSYQKLYNDAIGNPENGHGRYLHATHLKDHVVAFFYFHDTGGSTLKLQVGQFTVSSNSFSFSSRLFLHWSDFSLNDEIFLNDIYKIDDDKLAFASTSSSSISKQ